MKCCLKLFAISVPILLYCCSPASNRSVKPPFYIKLPPSWSVKVDEGVDSEAGYVEGPGVKLYYDYSNMGYADSLVPSERSFIRREKYTRPCEVCDTGVTYITTGDTKQAVADEKKKRGLRNVPSLKIEQDPMILAKETLREPTLLERKKYPTADKMLNLRYRNKTMIIDITFPPEIKGQVVQEDTTDMYVIKTTWPKIASKGITGVYIKSRRTTLNFSLFGKDLSVDDQVLALRSFKTLKLL